MTTQPDAGPGGSAAIAESVFATINGQDQYLTFRGENRSNPALMILSGPGVAFSGLPALFAAWERDFTLVHWDQPGAGATYDRNGLPQPYTFARLAADGAAAAQVAIARLGVQRIALFGLSGGSIIGLMMARARPDLFTAFVGSGQVVNWARQEDFCYGAILQRAKRTGDTDAVAALTRIGPPPWNSIADDAVASAYANAMTPAEQAAFAKLAPALVQAAAPAHDVRAVATQAFERLKPQFAAFDARDLGLSFDVPMIFLQGVQDLRTPASEVEAYATTVTAPRVVYEPIADGGHSAYLLTDEFLPRLKAHIPRSDSTD